MIASTFKREGFWKSIAEPDLPMPVPNGDPIKSQALFLEKLTQKESKALKLSYRGWSTCRICKCVNGTQSFQDRGWEWPSGYKHYIDVHNVRPSRDFYKFITKEDMS